MSLTSLLFDKQEPGNVIAKEADSMIDLGINTIIEAIYTQHDTCPSQPYYYQPLIELDNIHYRNAIFNDLENPDTLLIMRRLHQQLSDIVTQWQRIEKTHQPLEQLALRLRTFWQYKTWITTYSGHACWQQISSVGLSRLHTYLSQLPNQPHLKTLFNTLTQLTEDINNIHCLFQMHSKHIVAEKQNRSQSVIPDIHACFAQVGLRDIDLMPLKDSTFPYQANALHFHLIELVAQLHPELFAKLHELMAQSLPLLDKQLVQWSQELPFYLNFMHFKQPLNSYFCIADLSKQSGEENVSQFYDLSLLTRKHFNPDDLVYNDYQLTKQHKILYISGLNQGGKTTAARAIGQLHYFAKLGVPVAAQSAQLHWVDAIFTHFERSEVIAHDEGKLKQDIRRAVDIVSTCSPHSLVILNELFSSTTLQDATELNQTILEALMFKQCLVVDVSFITSLCHHHPSIRSYCSVIDNTAPLRRTYQIAPNSPGAAVFALELAKQHQLDTNSIITRLDKNKASL